MKLPNGYKYTRATPEGQLLALDSATGQVVRFLPSTGWQEVYQSDLLRSIATVSNQTSEDVLLLSAGKRALHGALDTALVVSSLDLAVVNGQEEILGRFSY